MLYVAARRPLCAPVSMLYAVRYLLYTVHHVLDLYAVLRALYMPIRPIIGSVFSVVYALQAL